MKASETYNKFVASLTGRCGYRAGEKILAAVSGGADSVCMFLMLKRFLPEGALGLAHFNHKLRGPESDRDEAFTRELADRLGVPFYYDSADISAAASDEKKGLEECAREYRYDFLKKTASDNGYDIISVAHNSGDNAETILMHIFRGCSVDGLCGLRYRSDNIIRPLLDIDRASILEYLQEEHASYVTDSSNADNSFMRNRVRNELLPYISEKLGYDAGRVLLRQTEISSAERDYLESRAAEFVSENTEMLSNGDVLLDPEAFRNTDKAIGRRALRHMIASVKDINGDSPYGGRTDIEFSSIERAAELILSGRKGPEAEIGRGIKVRLTHSGALFYIDRSNEEKASADAEDQTNGFESRTLPGEEAAIVRTGRGFTPGNGTVFFDKAKYIAIINASGKAPVLRPFETGDSIIPFGMTGRKKIRKLLIDMKVPYEKRKSIRVLASGNEVLWVPGLCTSELLRITDETEEILQINIQEER
ncbi:MAG: tRNA lysidine(34) synthetase TilS [Clostridia bacterium]|nr:tRNA lysidine(34) synthetase TilS [Clostridia bacterium]